MQQFTLKIIARVTGEFYAILHKIYDLSNIYNEEHKNSIKAEFNPYSFFIVN